jgi:probable AcnD-accessory protein PrpF
VKPRTIPAVFMRGGTSKGVFFQARDLPSERAERDAMLLRLLGSPDPYARQTDGMGGATSSTSKVVIVSPSTRSDCQVDFLFGAVSIGEPLIDWSGNCGNLSAAVGPFAISQGLVPALEGHTRVRIWQQNIGQRIDALVPVRNGEPLEEGDFMEDGVPFPGAEIRLEFMEADPDRAPPLLPTGAVQDDLQVPGLGTVRATLITAGNPTVFVRADALGLTGRELPAELEGRAELLARLEAIRAIASVRMGLADSPQEASRLRPATPKVAWVAPPADSRSSAGVAIGAEQVDVLARIMSMGKLHHAFTGTGSIAVAAAAVLPGSVVHELVRVAPGQPLRIGHVSGRLSVGAVLGCPGGRWRFDKAVLSRSARRLMSGLLHLPSTPVTAGVSQAA